MGALLLIPLPVKGGAAEQNDLGVSTVRSIIAIPGNDNFAEKTGVNWKKLRSSHVPPPACGKALLREPFSSCPCEQILDLTYSALRDLDSMHTPP